MEKDKSYKNSTLYLKAEEISKLCQQISVLCEQDESQNQDFIHRLGRDLLEDSYLICVKIAGCWNSDLYDLKMENATLIRKAAREILLATTGLMIRGFQNEDYLLLIREK